MGYYTEEEDVWKCRKHPRKHRTAVTGVCPLCLRDRLIRLCPECANVRPCACLPTPPQRPPDAVTSVGAIGRMSNLIEKEPAFQRSRSTAAAAFPFLLRSKTSKGLPPAGNRNRQLSFWSSVFSGAPKLKKVEEAEEEREMKMMRSRSVGMSSSSCASDSDQGRRSDVRLKGGRNWYFPSPIKALRGGKTTTTTSTTSKILQQSSPLCRG